MGAADNLHPEQLGMFYPAHVLKARVGFLDGDLGSNEVTDRTAGGSTKISRPYKDGPPSRSYHMEKQTHAEGWEQKAEEADERGLTSDIRDTGVVRDPVIVVPNEERRFAGYSAAKKMSTEDEGAKPYTLHNGHHRIAAALDVDRNMEVPALHYESGTTHAGHEPRHQFGAQFGHIGPIADRPGPIR